MKRINATAIRDTSFRERATSSHEAAHAGTMYPRRRWCIDGATKREIFAP